MFGLCHVLDTCMTETAQPRFATDPSRAGRPLMALAVFALTALWLMNGCVIRQAASPAVAPPPAQSQNQPKDQPLKEPLKEPPPRLVAIVPFDLPSGAAATEEEKAAAEIIRRTLANHLRARHYGTQRPAETDARLQGKGLIRPEEVLKLPAGRLGAITRADAVVFGQIAKIERGLDGPQGKATVEIKLRMVKAETGTVVWKQGTPSPPQAKKSVGAPTGPPMLPAPAGNAFVSRHMAVQLAANELFREMLQTLPVGKAGDAVKEPMVRQVMSDASTLTRKTGDQITVWLQGDAQLRATFDVGPYRPDQAMTEAQPGLYTGFYNVQPGDNATALTIVGHLSDPAGATLDWEDVFGPVTLDTDPPPAPTGLTVLTEDQAVNLRWKPNREADLAGYRIYKNIPPSTEFQLLGTSDMPFFKDTKELMNRKPSYYKVAAVDKVGNESKWSEAVIGVPVASGPTPVKGTIQVKTTWYAGESPYVLEGDVVVAPEATLTIEAGTVVKSKGGALIVRGSLLARGTAEQAILLTAESDSQEHPWSGIVFDRTGERENVLERVRVTKAAVGVTCLGASPKIVASELVENGVGLKVSQAAAHPLVERTQIARNLEDGVSVQDSAAPVLTANRIVQNKRHGLALTHAPHVTLRGNAVLDNGGLQLWNATATAPVEASGNWWGTSDGEAVLAKVDGAVKIDDYLDGPEPVGKLVVLPALGSDLGGALADSAFLLLSKSPYVVSSPLVIGKGATLVIQAGVVIRFKEGDNSLVVRGGAIHALGTKHRPIALTSANASPKPGDYVNAVRFEGAGASPSVLKHVRIDSATIALHVAEGSPEIAHAVIARNLQSALECGGQSSPKVSYSTLAEHLNNAAVICSGQARPALHHNNIVKNAWGVINHSSQPLDAKDNWWGAAQPDDKLFLGTVTVKPALKQPEPDAAK
ncbi:MAG: right-handed parallel beta-helix repeat-containing protein [Nitrospira sp.]|nr:right-handed parallel beta-helix repeat-containing protein [Nitrospira sp.]